MNKDFSRKELLSTIKAQVSGAFQEYLLKEVSEEKLNFASLIEKTTNQIADGDTTQALKNLTGVISEQLGEQASDSPNGDQDPSFTVEWVDMIHEHSKKMEAQILLPQEEARFRSDKSDSIMLKIGKTGKRTLRNFQKAGRSIRSLLKSEKEPDPVWTQRVPIQNIISYMLLDIAPIQKKWSNQLFKLKAEFLLETDAWTLHSSGLIKSQEEATGSSEQENDQASSTKEPDTSSKDVVQNPNRQDLLTFFQEALNELEHVEQKMKNEIQNTISEIESQIEIAISVTDTIERSISDYSDQSLEQKEQKLLQSIKSERDHWQKLLGSLLSRCQLSMDFISLYNQSKERIDGFSASLEDFFATNFEEPALHLLGQIQKTAALFENTEKHTTKEIQKLSQERLKEIDQHIENNLLKPGDELIQDAVLGTKLERFTSAIPEWTKNQREHAVLLEKLDLTMFPPAFELEEVDWQSLVQRVLNNQIAKEFVPKETKPEEFLNTIQRDIHEIAQIILTNIEVADEVKKTDEEEPLQVAREGLERARLKLEEVITKISTKKTEFREKLSDKKQVAFSKLAMLLEKQNVNEVRITGAQYMAKETAVDWKVKFQVYWAVISEKAELFGRFIWIKLKSYYELISNFLGFSKNDPIEGDTTDLATFLSKTDEQIAGLPFIYRRLFDFNKEVEDRFYIRKPEQFERIKRGYELWQNNFPSSFSIVGEKGSGKTLFIRLMMNEVLKKHDIVEVNFKDTVWKPNEVVAHIAKNLKIDDAETFEDLMAAIKRKKKRMIVILENVQNCFIRNISGFEAMEQLLLLISETNKEILWIASSTRYGWLYLDKVLNVVDYFTHAVETDNLSAQQIEELILRRHRASGYQLNFLADEASKSSRTYKKHLDDNEKSQAYLKERYFEKLAKMSEGNSSVAMIYWIRSIKEYDDTHFHINPFEFGEVNRIQELDSNELFALAAFILHDSLTPEELSMAVHQSKRESQLTVSRLSSQSILVKSEYGFTINQLIYRQIARVLKEANFIH
jgi:AraC-like DNA-binding protein